ncbi:MAG TPA: STAS domain-containing protein [Verrucomicrobiae bacterium]|nr:STAS domain-containing protein [Verrucomicrobiae bacterium]
MLDSADKPRPALPIAGELTIQTVDQIHKLLVDSIRRTPNLRIDFSAVDTCDTAGLQLICSLCAPPGPQIAALSPAIESAAAEIGLAISKIPIRPSPGGPADGI